MTGPDPRAALPDVLRGVEVFRITDLDLDERTWTARLGYAFDDRISFTEVVTLPAPPSSTDVEGDDVLRALRLLHVVAGTSYWKAAAPRRVVAEGLFINSWSSAAEQCYEAGMREFAHRGGLGVPVDVTVEAPMAITIVYGERSGYLPPVLDPKPLIPVGGGKDSALCASMLPEAALFSVNAPGAAHRVAAAAGRPLLEATRTIDPLLRELNEQGALNGHVPVTAITSCLAVATAVLHGYTDVVMGIERSASEPTRIVDGVPINHQHAKSWEFEQALGGAVLDATSFGVRWWSALRPFSELAIARALVPDDAQMGAFLSCNRAFTIWRETPQSIDQSWCLECPKCLFTFLAFAPFLSVERAVDVFGGNPLADPARTQEFAALFSRDGKPFECVGELLESAVAMATLADRPGWRDLPVVRETAAEAVALAATNGATLADQLTPTDVHAIPEDYVPRIFTRLTDGGGS